MSMLLLQAQEDCVVGVSTFSRFSLLCKLMAMFLRTVHYVFCCWGQCSKYLVGIALAGNCTRMKFWPFQEPTPLSVCGVGLFAFSGSRLKY